MTTKEKAYTEFINDIKSITKDIENNIAGRQYYIKLTELYQRVGLDEERIKDLLRPTSLESIIDLFDNRQRLERDRKYDIIHALGVIEGINIAIEKKLRTELKENPT